MKTNRLKMSQNNESAELALAISAIRDLITAKVEAEAQIADYLEHLASAKAMLHSVRTEPKTPENKQYLKAAGAAWRASIRAYELGIMAYQGDIDSYNEEIDVILKRTPEARQDH
jgi:hypothetical protein